MKKISTRSKSLTFCLATCPLLVILLLFYSNCSPVGKSLFPRESASNTQCLSKSAPALAKMVGKTSEFLNGKFDSSFSSLTSLDFNKKPLDVVALLETSCVSKTNSISKATLSSNLRRDLSVQSFSIRIHSFEEWNLFRADVERDPCVIGVSREVRLKSTVVSNDLYADELKHLEAIRINKAWSDLLPVSKPVIVAIVDSGIDYTHPDLSASMWQNSSGQYGVDLENNDSDPKDDNGHGTHLAGLVGAGINNSIGVAGVLGSGARLMAVKVADSDGYSLLSNVANGIRWAADRGAQVIVLSLGADTVNSVLEAAVDYALSKNVVIVAAAGNDARSVSPAAPMIPAFYAATRAGMISVAATVAETGELASFSNYSPTYIEIAAPGSVQSLPKKGVLSTYPNNRYAYLPGTSMATPIVGGAAALAISSFLNRNVSYTAAAIESILFESSLKKSNLISKVKQGQSLDLFALSSLLQDDSVLIITQQPESQKLLAGSLLNLVVQSTQQDSASYQWQKDGSDIAGATGSQFTIPKVTRDDAGKYKVRISNQGEETISEVAQVEIYDSICP